MDVVVPAPATGGRESTGKELASGQRTRPAGRDIQVVELGQALRDLPRLVLHALDEARTLADRDGRWAMLHAKRGVVQAAARKQARTLEAEQLGLGRAGDDVGGRGAGGSQSAGAAGGEGGAGPAR